MKRPPIAYYLGKHDNNSVYLPSELLCPSCGSKQTREHINQTFVPEKKTLDLSATQDGFTIASRTCKSVFEGLRVSGVKFRDLPATNRFFLFEVGPVIEYDCERSGTLHEDFCQKCQNYQSVTGMTPIFLKDDMAGILDGIFRTDVEFGGGHEKSPALIVGVELANKLRSAKLKGVYFEPVFSHSSGTG